MLIFFNLCIVYFVDGKFEKAVLFELSFANKFPVMIFTKECAKFEKAVLFELIFAKKFPLVMIFTKECANKIFDGSIKK
jgi:hypothetical protein